MKRRGYHIPFGWVVVAVLVSLAIHAFSHQETTTMRETTTQRETTQRKTTQRETTTPQGDGAWTGMPEAVVEMCTAAPLKKTPEMVVQRRAYVASYNRETRCPNWVAWLLTAEHTDGELKRMSNFHEDEDCPLPRATPKDYKGSGWSRGHMCPAGDNKWDWGAMYDSFSLVNVCPQNSKLNSGLWNSIEMDCRKWARKYGEVYVVCGPVWMKGEHETIGENRVAVPEAFFKVVLCLTGKPKAFGFIVRNTEGNRKKDVYYNSVDQVERITGIDFFPALPDDIENKVEARADMNEW